MFWFLVLFSDKYIWNLAPKSWDKFHRIFVPKKPKSSSFPEIIDSLTFPGRICRLRPANQRPYCLDWVPGPCIWTLAYPPSHQDPYHLFRPGCVGVLSYRVQTWRPELVTGLPEWLCDIGIHGRHRSAWRQQTESIQTADLGHLTACNQGLWTGPSASGLRCWHCQPPRWLHKTGWVCHREADHLPHLAGNPCNHKKENNYDK